MNAPPAAAAAPLDWLVLTAANNSQAHACRAQLRDRGPAVLGAIARHWLVVPDPKNRRAGSGGSTLAVLLRIAARRATLLAAGRRGGGGGSGRSVASLFAGQRILIIHSGGDSKRLPAYAAQGKIFTPLPTDRPDGIQADLFDLILADLAAIPLDPAGRVLIASGDVLLNIAGQRPLVNAPGVVGVAFEGPPAVGARHGVYVAADDSTVRDFLQKPSPEAAARAGALTPGGGVLVDTGLVSLDTPTVARLLHAAGLRRAGSTRLAGRGWASRVLAGTAPLIDLYSHILMAAAPNRSFQDYLARLGPAANAPLPLLASIHRALAGTPFTVAQVDRCDFLHLGSTRELLAGLAPGSVLRATRQGSAPLCTISSPGPALHLPRNARGIVEACDLRSCNHRFPHLGGDNLLVGAPAAALKNLSLPPGWGMVWLPIGAKDWSAVLFGSTDDQKTPLHQGGTLGNRPLTDWLGRPGLSPAVLWGSLPPERHTTWEARLWPIGSISEVRRATDWLLTPAAPPPRRWLTAERRSLAQLMARVNLARLQRDRAELQRLARLQRWQSDDQIPAQPTALLLADARGQAERRRIARSLAPRARLGAKGPADQIDFARLAAVQRALIDGQTPPPGSTAPPEVLAPIAAMVLRAAPIPPRPARIVPSFADAAVRVTAPVRIDLAGGWTDTPPMCFQRGGAVVNMAVTLHGEHPVSCEARLTDRPVVALTSDDQGQSVEFSTPAQVRAALDARRWTALPAAALLLTGLIPGRRGPGLQLRLAVNIPKGSGLGTSSILAATILAALHRVTGLNQSETPDRDLLIRQVLAAEQLIGTGGGWQDQAGGIRNGTEDGALRLLTTEPGPCQVPRCEPLRLPASLATRGLLYYTGHTRMARGILHAVVMRYLHRDPAVLRLLDDLRAGAMAMREALAAGDEPGFERELNRYWSCKKAIDPGATNSRLEAIIRSVAPWLAACELPGAGGGGFLFMVARDAAAARRIVRHLTKNPPNSRAGFYPFAPDEQGLRVSIL